MEAERFNEYDALSDNGILVVDEGLKDLSTIYSIVAKNVVTICLKICIVCVYFSGLEKVWTHSSSHCTKYTSTSCWGEIQPIPLLLWFGTIGKGRHRPPCLVKYISRCCRTWWGCLPVLRLLKGCYRQQNHEIPWKPPGGVQYSADEVIRCNLSRIAEKAYKKLV